MENIECYNFAEKVFQSFINQFNEIYDLCCFEDKEDILSYADSIFFKWYNSSYFKKTILTPYKLIEQYILRCTGEKNSSRIVLKRVKSKKINSFKIQKIDYGIKKHAAAEDLILFLKNCQLYSSLGIDCLSGVKNKFSFFSEDYIGYLFEIALKLNLFDKLSSIHTENDIYVPNDKIDEYSQEELINKMCYAAIELSCDKLNFLLYEVDAKLKERFTSANDYMIVFDRAFDEYVITEIVRRVTEVHDIQLSILEVFDININDIIAKKKYLLTDDEKFFLDLYNWLGRKIEECFVIPFSLYLNIFIPYYMDCFDIDTAFKSFFYEKRLKNNSSIGFVTCGRFQLTRLGEEIFDIKIEDEFEKNFNEISPEEVLNFLTDDYVKSRLLGLMTSNIVKLKISSVFDKENNAIIEFIDELTLEQLHKEICLRFFEPAGLDYSFYPGEIESPFIEYPSRIKNKSTDANKAAEACSVKEMIENGADKFILVINDENKKSRYLIEYIDTKKSEIKKYPSLGEIGSHYIKKVEI